jgi:hypothetical protein
MSRSRGWFSPSLSAPPAARTAPLSSYTLRARDRGRGDGDDPEDVFRREGDYWSVVFEGHTVHVRDLKGCAISRSF